MTGLTALCACICHYRWLIDWSSVIPRRQRRNDGARTRTTLAAVETHPAPVALSIVSDFAKSVNIADRTQRFSRNSW